MKTITIDPSKLPKFSTGWLDPWGPFGVTYTFTVTLPKGAKFTRRQMAAALRRAARDLEKSRRTSGRVR